MHFLLQMMSGVFTIRSNICGYLVYGEHWTAILGEKLTCEREIGNVVDGYTVAVKNDGGQIIAHVPRKISRMCSSFLELGVQIMAKVAGH